MMKVILMAGGAGFIGSNFIKYFLRRNKTYIIVNIDKLTYGANLESLREIEDSPRYHFVKGDICNQELVNYILKRYKPDYIINCAGESNSSRSLEHPGLFTQTNVMGTLTLLEGMRFAWNRKSNSSGRFIQVSTDEVYGENRDNTFFSEESPLVPGNPFAASKAAADMLVQCYNKSYGMPTMIARCCNAYGPYQHIENIVPGCIMSALNDKSISIPDSRLSMEWMHVLDLSVALIRTMFYGKPGEIYNIGSGEEASHADLAHEVLRLMGKSEDMLKLPPAKADPVRRYALNSYKARSNLNWSSKYSLEEGLKDTIRWYKSNRNWWDMGTGTLSHS